LGTSRKFAIIESDRNLRGWLAACGRYVERNVRAYQGRINQSLVNIAVFFLAPLPGAVVGSDRLKKVTERVRGTTAANTGE
jgi:hypothetical protein